MEWTPRFPIMPIDSERSSLYYDNGRQGFIYVLNHPLMCGANPVTGADLPLLKIGATRKHPLQRLDELSAATGVPTPFALAFYRDFADAFTAERLVHAKFTDQRISTEREFFVAPLDDVVAFINAMPTSVDYREELTSQGVTGGDYQRPVVLPDTPFAELFSTFDPDGPAELTAAERADCRALEASLAR